MCLRKRIIVSNKKKLNFDPTPYLEQVGSNTKLKTDF